MIRQKLADRLALLLTVAALTACAGTGMEQSKDRVRSQPVPTPQQSAVLSDQSPQRQEAKTASETVTVTGSRVRKADLERIEGNHRSAASALAANRSLSAFNPQCCQHVPTQELDRENYAHTDPNPVRAAAIDPVSTFSIDVDTGSYSNVRRFLNQGRLPPHDAVRVEELINYFAYKYPAPRTSGTPFNVITQLAQTPWNRDTILMQVGLKGFEVPAAQRPPANLVFLVDVSGSMRSPDKLPLLKEALMLLTEHLDERDSVAIAGYAGGAGIILEPTNGSDKRAIFSSLQQLTAAGRTNGAAGIEVAYDLAASAFIEGGINRVILATDGDFNVGTVNFEALINLIEHKREHGVALTTLGFGTGNYNDKLMEQLADAGNGNYAYIDNQREARKVLVEQLSSTLQTIAKDVKIQIEFNPAVVAEYRLIGYENRILRREDFNNDRIDAGEIGAGHTVTALYELSLVGSPAALIDPLRYGPFNDQAPVTVDELAFVRLRYKKPQSDRSKLIERPVRLESIKRIDGDFAFAAAVAAFGQRLSGADYLQGFDFDQIASLAANAMGSDRNGYREEFVALVGQASSLAGSMAEKTGQSSHHYHVVN